MEPVTHALTSLALGRAGLNRVTRLAIPMLLVSGLAADLDWISYPAGASAFLQWRQAASHSLLAAAIISVLLAAGFCLCSRRGDPQRRVTFLPALAVCACGAGMHLLLDLASDTGVELFWPFNVRKLSWDLAPGVDPALLAILLAGLLVPSLLNLVSEEIGARGRKRPGARGAVVALCLMLACVGGRAAARQRAGALLNAHTYRNEVPIRSGVFPSVSPLLWHGVVETQTALYQAEVSLLPGVEFDPRTARGQLKPDDSPILLHAVASEPARKFLAIARFPLARVRPLEDGFEVRIEDLRALAAAPGSGEIIAVISLNSRQQVTGSKLLFASEAGR